MRSAGAGLLMACALGLGTSLFQGLGSPAADRPLFDRISIERSTGEAPSPYREWTPPDGSLHLVDVTPAQLLSRAYPFEEYDIEGLPDWSLRERYDVRATSVAPNPTPDERQGMVRALLADRFGLRARVEPREMDAYDMVVARDGRLGPRLEASDVDCAVVRAPWWLGGYPSPERDVPRRHACIPWHELGSLQGTLTMAELAGWLREFVGRPVVDRTGLSGYYAVTVRLSRRRPAIDTIRDDLGLQLVPSHVVRETVVVERLHSPGV